MDENKVEERAAAVILDRGVRYRLGEDDITIRPLRFGAVLEICRRACRAGLTAETIRRGKENAPQFFLDYGGLMLDCVAVAEINDRQALSEEKIAERTAFYRDNLTLYQVYELFVHVLNLSGIEDFTAAIRLLFTMRERYLSPKEKGS